MNTEITEYGKVNGWIYFDANCRFCTAMAARFQHLLASHRFELLPLQTPGLAERLHLPESQLLVEMRVLRPDGKSFGGADALLEIARDFWWAWPLRQLGRIPAVRRILHAGYRWLASNRSCDAGGCEVKGHNGATKSWIGDVLPLVALPLMALFFKGRLAGWVFMWAMAFALYWGCKWLTYREAVRRGLRPGPARVIAYLLAWPGMDAGGFLDSHTIPAKTRTIFAGSVTTR